MFQYYFTQSAYIPPGIGFRHYGPLHLAWLVGILFFCIWICRYYRRLPVGKRRLFQKRLCVLMLLMEAYKYTIPVSYTHLDDPFLETDDFTGGNNRSTFQNVGFPFADHINFADEAGEYAAFAFHSYAGLDDVFYGDDTNGFARTSQEYFDRSNAVSYTHLLTAIAGSDHSTNGRYANGEAIMHGNSSV